MNHVTHNYHTHTTRCMHAKGTDREYIEHAIKAGIQVLGFSDHTPMTFDSGFVSPVRMAPEETEEYFTTLTALREEYKNDIEIHIGFETEYYPDTFDAYLETIKPYPVEYMVLGQHFLFSEDKHIIPGTPSDDEERMCIYYDTVTEAMGTGKFLYVAHPDLINFTGNSEIYVHHTTAFLQKMKDMGVVLGLNRYGMFEHRSYPKPLFWEIAGMVGNKAIIELDAHTPEVFDDAETVEICKTFADKNGVELVDSLELHPEAFR